jgi:hypothetical protein
MYLGTNLKFLGLTLSKRLPNTYKDLHPLCLQSRMFHHVWPFLAIGIDYVMTGNNISYSYGMWLYTAIYNCMTGPGVRNGRMAEALYKRAKEHFDDYIVNIAGMKPLRIALVLILKSAWQQANDLTDDSKLLEYYTSEWRIYESGVYGRSNAFTLHRIFSYLNRHWVKTENDRGNKELYHVEVVCDLITFICVTSQTLFLDGGHAMGVQILEKNTLKT